MELDGKGPLFPASWRNTDPSPSFPEVPTLPKTGKLVASPLHSPIPRAAPQALLVPAALEGWARAEGPEG